MLLIACKACGVNHSQQDGDYCQTCAARMREIQAEAERQEKQQNCAAVRISHALSACDLCNKYFPVNELFRASTGETFCVLHGPAEVFTENQCERLTRALRQRDADRRAERLRQFGNGNPVSSVLLKMKHEELVKIAVGLMADRQLTEAIELIVDWKACDPLPPTEFRARPARETIKAKMLEMMASRQTTDAVELCIDWKSAKPSTVSLREMTHEQVEKQALELMAERQVVEGIELLIDWKAGERQRQQPTHAMNEVDRQSHEMLAPSVALNQPSEDQCNVCGNNFPVDELIQSTAGKVFCEKCGPPALFKDKRAQREAARKQKEQAEFERRKAEADRRHEEERQQVERKRQDQIEYDRQVEGTTETVGGEQPNSKSAPQSSSLGGDWGCATTAVALLWAIGWMIAMISNATPATEVDLFGSKMSYGFWPAVAFFVFNFLWGLVVFGVIIGALMLIYKYLNKA